MNIMNRFVSRLTFSASILIVPMSVAQSAEELLNFNVNEAGVYQVTFEQLLDAGLDIEGEPISNLAVTNRGMGISIQIKGSEGNPQLFGAGGFIRFIGEELETLYTGTNVYTLSLDASSQVLIDDEFVPLTPRVPYATSYLATKEYAPQTGYSFASPDNKDPWYAKRMLALNKPTNETVDLVLDGYVPGGNTGVGKARMKVKVWGGSDLPGLRDDHHVRVRFNGEPVIDETFDGFNKKEMSSDLSNLRVGSNSVGLELPLDQGFQYEAVNLDAIEVTYPRGFIAENNALSFNSSSAKFRIKGFSNSQILVYQQSDDKVIQLIAAETSSGCDAQRPTCSVRFSGSQSEPADYHVVAANSFKTPSFAFTPLEQNIRSGEAEYLIITHPDFIAGAGDTDLLGALTQSLSDSFSSVDVVDVEQIYAQFGHHIFDPQAIQDYIKFAHQNRATKMILLVGGDIYDYRGFENQDARSFIPSIYVATGDLISFAPVDAKYADVDDDDIPDLAIGRLPIRSMSELQVLLNKRDAYNSRTYTKQALFTADGFDEVEQYSFKRDAQTVQNDYFQDWAVDQVFTDDIGVSEARNRIVERINQGVSLTSFFGHSSTNQWTFDGLFNGFDAANLNNAGRPTIVTQWGCWNTYYVNPNEESMGHRFMMEGDRGAVAVMGPTTLTRASNERILASLVFDRLTKGQTLGEAITQGKQDYVLQRNKSLDVILGWTLLGFPDLVL